MCVFVLNNSFFCCPFSLILPFPDLLLTVFFFLIVLSRSLKLHQFVDGFPAIAREMCCLFIKRATDARSLRVHCAAALRERLLAGIIHNEYLPLLCSEKGGNLYSLHAALTLWEEQTILPKQTTPCCLQAVGIAFAHGNQRIYK